MSARASTNYFEKDQEAPIDDSEDIMALPVRYVPVMLSALRTRLGRSFWKSREDWIRGNSALQLAQWRLLMGGLDDLITEIRDIRGLRSDAPPEPETGYPIGEYPGIQLRDQLEQAYTANLNRETEHNAQIAKLDEIKAAIEAAGADSDEIIDILGRLAIFFGV